MAMHANISTKVNAVCIAANYHLEEIISIYLGTDQAIHDHIWKKKFLPCNTSKGGNRKSVFFGNESEQHP